MLNEWKNKSERESMDEIMIHYASIGRVIMYDEWDHPTSGQVDKWTSGWGVHNNCFACDGVRIKSLIVCLAVSVLLHHQIQFSGESFSFTLICKRSFSQLVADCSCKKIAEIAKLQKKREKERQGNCSWTTNPTKNQKRKDTYLVKHH